VYLLIRSVAPTRWYTGLLHQVHALLQLVVGTNSGSPRASSIGHRDQCDKHVGFLGRSQRLTMRPPVPPHQVPCTSSSSPGTNSEAAGLDEEVIAPHEEVISPDEEASAPDRPEADGTFSGMAICYESQGLSFSDDWTCCVQPYCFSIFTSSLAISSLAFSATVTTNCWSLQPGAEMRIV
jgi:hypothetical protein